MTVRMCMLAALILCGSCQTKQSVPGLLEYRCKDGKVFWVDLGDKGSLTKPPAKAIVHYDDKAIAIPASPEVDGIRYSDGLTTWTLRNGVGRLRTQAGLYENCQATP